jgi:hypothetical protein
MFLPYRLHQTKTGIKFIVLFFFLLQVNVFAGAWSQKQGHYYTKISYIYSTSDVIFGYNDPVLYDNSSIYLYGEYGIWDHFTVIGSIPALKYSVTEANFLRGETTGYMAGDMEFKGLYQFLFGPVVASGIIGVKIPFSYDIYDIPPIGNGEADFDVKLALGASFYPLPGYATGDVGYRLRGGEFIDEINFTFEVGYTLLNKFLIRFYTDGIRGIREAEGESNLIGFPLSQERIRLGGGLIYIWDDNIAFDFTYLDTIHGKYIPRFKEVFLGISYAL